MLAHITAIAWLAVAQAAPSAGVSYRNNGTARAPDGVLPDSWELGSPSVRWRTPIASWSNASPVAVGDLVCVLAEPITLSCYDADTGSLRWTADTTVGDAMTGAARQAWFTGRDEAIARATQADELQRAYSAARRALRRDPTNSELVADMARMGEELRTLRVQVAEDTDRYLTPDNREILGYTSQSPVTNGTHIFAQFGTGVVAAFTLKGERAWTVYLGPARSDMHGYHVGTSASPSVSGSHLIVGHNKLHALDTATGSVRWTSIDYREYGSPAVATIGSTAVVLTPDGHLVRARDGEVLQSNLPASGYAGASVYDGVSYTVRGYFTDRAHDQPPARADAWTLTETAPGQVTAKALWSTPVPGQLRFYSPPTVNDAHVFATDDSASLWRFDRKTGAVTSFPMPRMGPGYPAPVLIGDRLLITGESGESALVDPNDPGGAKGRAHAATMRATPLSVGRRTYLRTLDALWCLEAQP